MNAETIANDAIGLFLEYRDQHGYPEPDARSRAVGEVAEGAASRESVGAGLDELRAALWQCGIESGMDTDGDGGPGALIAGMGDAGFAAAMIDQVRQLRCAYDEVLGEGGTQSEWLRDHYTEGMETLDD